MRAGTHCVLTAFALAALVFPGAAFAQHADARASATPDVPATPARTQGQEPGPTRAPARATTDARAAKLTEDAQRRYNTGDFENAAEAYRRAYLLVPAPELLFNLGQCQRLLGRPERAVRYFESYLRLRPDAPERPLVEQLIAEARRVTPAPASPPAISAQDRASSPSQIPTTERAHGEGATVMPLPPPQPLPEPRRLIVDDRYAEDDSPAVYERWWFWTAVAVVAVGAAATTYAVIEASEPAPTATASQAQALSLVQWR